MDPHVLYICSLNLMGVGEISYIPKMHMQVNIRCLSKSLKNKKQTKKPHPIMRLLDQGRSECETAQLKSTDSPAILLSSLIMTSWQQREKGKGVSQQDTFLLYRMVQLDKQKSQAFLAFWVLRAAKEMNKREALLWSFLDWSHYKDKYIFKSIF